MWSELLGITVAALAGAVAAVTGFGIHPGMAATIIATSTPYTAVADSEGRFAISDVPAGAYIAAIYVGGQRLERAVQIPEGPTALDLTSGASE